MKESTKMILKEDFESEGFIMKDYEKASKFKTKIQLYFLVMILIAFFAGAIAGKVQYYQHMLQIASNCVKTFSDLPTHQTIDLCKSIVGVAP